jgi:hypothetical protein
MFSILVIGFIVLHFIHEALPHVDLLCDYLPSTYFSVSYTRYFTYFLLYAAFIQYV